MTVPPRSQCSAPVIGKVRYGSPPTAFIGLHYIFEIQTRTYARLMVLLPLLCLATGCSTSFKYTPQHNRAYHPVTRQPGLAIARGEDLRTVDTIRPAWTQNAEAIVAQALANEVKHGKLFQRVKIHADPVNPQKYSTVVQFWVLKFECYNQADFLQSAGRDLLQMQVPGFRGSLIAASIPVKYVSEVEIEFTVLDAASGQSLFIRTYSATRSDSFNGYQGDKPEVLLTSTTLEAVLTQFVADMANLPLNHPSP